MLLETASRPVRPRRVTAAAVGWLLACVPCAAGQLEDALRLVPADAVGAAVVPSLKAASDDLQLAVDAAGRAEAALGGRPIDLLKAQLGIGAGFDDRGALALWAVRRDGALRMACAVPVVDADAFVAATFVDAPELGKGAMRVPGRDVPAWVRKAGRHVLVADAAGVLDGWEPKDGFAALIEPRLGRRAMEIVRTADAFAWASRPVMESWSLAVRAAADSDREIAEMLAAAGAGEGAPQERLADAASHRARSGELLEQVEDAVIAFDFDALAVGIRAWARFADGSELAKALPPARTQPRDVATLLGRLPRAAPYGAMGLDLRAMGGLAHLRSVLATMPEGDRLRLPEWVDRVQDKVDEVQVAAYPSKLGVMVGGLLNDASFVVVTSDPAAVKGALRAWVESRAGERDGVRTEASWEDARQLKDGSTAAAFAVKETFVEAGPDMMAMLARQLLVGARGVHGFAREVPGGLVVTYSQRLDVLDRATKAASGGPSLGSDPVVRAMVPWLVPDADAVALLGAGELLGAARQVAAMVPGGDPAMVPEAPRGLEPVALALRSNAGTWEMAAVVPSRIIGVAIGAGRAAATQAEPGAGSEPAPAPVPGPATAP
jgi:hypothetical protein